MVVRLSKQRQHSMTRRSQRIVAYSLFLLGCSAYILLATSWYTHADASLTAQAKRLDRPPVYIHLNTVRLYAPAFTYSTPSSVWYMTNKSHPIKPHTYTPHDLTPLPIPSQPQLSGELASVRKTVASALVRLDASAKRDNVQLMVNSAYRPYLLQEQLITETSSSLYDTGTRTAPAGTSEHQLGLAVDFSSDTPGCRTASVCAISPEASAWLADHAHHYGFTLRYPEDKEAITGYEYEPWHYRYVGKLLAEALHESGMTLDEAWPNLKQAEKELRLREVQ